MSPFMLPLFPITQPAGITIRDSSPSPTQPLLPPPLTTTPGAVGYYGGLLVKVRIFSILVQHPRGNNSLLISWFADILKVLNVGRKRPMPLYRMPP
ncbi:unnamed protein product [Gongylonema pulchrum]|uniref:Ovule protein n=1 Tax=Gongylonema pulchrum TaxID=637853 RepID=A0A183E2X5_9BILA|nr:unnamed protein product [Gongylonema pulchrum]